MVRYIIPIALTAVFQTVQASQPNIIFILADDLGYGDLSCYGQTKFQTPHIDRLAQDGIRFTQHYAGCTVSAPSRSSLMTGLHTGHTPIRGNKEHKEEGQYPLSVKTPTVASLLKEAGYATGAFGKWGLGYPGSVGDPNNQGFDEFYGYNCQRQAHNYYPFHLWHNQQRIMLPGNEGSRKEQYAADLIHEKAMSFIRENKNRPFFAFLPYVHPHAELSVPDDSVRQHYQHALDAGKPYKGNDNPASPRYKNGDYGSSDNPHADFAAMMVRLDGYVGDITRELKELGLDQNTLVIFTSDNGPHREGGANPDFFQSYGPLRGSKRDLYEGGIRVPFIATWPGRIPIGRNSSHISAFWDILPTLAEVGGVESIPPVDGLSILPTLVGSGEQQQHPFLYWEFHERGGRVALRYGDWKAVKLDYGVNPDAPMELYHLSEDIHEDRNVAAHHPELVAKLERILKEARTPSPIFNFGRN